ncbi:fibronectin type III domain-containing protein 9 [Stigmatopora argus]
MAVDVHDISATSAEVTWPPSPGCLDTFYSVMYSPNWNSLLAAFARKSFAHEERLPVSQTSAHLANLLPQTTYLLCVTCQAANPTRDQCQVFGTPADDGDGRDGAGRELAAGAWLSGCALLLVVAAVLFWLWRRGGRAGRPRPSPSTHAIPSGRLYSLRGARGELGSHSTEMEPA